MERMRQTIACLEEEVDDTRLGYQHLLMGQESQLTSLRAELALLQETCVKSSLQCSPHSSGLRCSKPSQPHLTASSPVLCIPASTTASCQTDTPCSSPSDALSTSSILSSDMPSHTSHTSTAMGSQTDLNPAGAPPAQEQCSLPHITAVTGPGLMTSSCSQTDAYPTTSAPAQGPCSLTDTPHSTVALPTTASTSQTEESQPGVPQSLEQKQTSSAYTEPAPTPTTLDSPSPATATSTLNSSTDPCTLLNPITASAAQHSIPPDCQVDAAPVGHSQPQHVSPVFCDSATSTHDVAATAAAGTQTAIDGPARVCSTGTQTDQVEEAPLNSREQTLALDLAMLTKRYNNALADKLDAEEAAALMEADRDALAAELELSIEQVATLQSEAMILTSRAANANSAYEKLRAELASRIRSSKQSAPGRQRRSPQVNWHDQEIFISRSPGRLDVMGGIADYSGSLVLQMPIKQGCHVALQRLAVPTVAPEDESEESDREGGGDDSARGHMIRICSYGSDHADRRSPNYEVPVGVLFPGGQPLPYAVAQQLFKQPRTVTVSRHQCGAGGPSSLPNSLEQDRRRHAPVRLQVSEGKGVSSSAAVEVSTMMALLAAYSVEVEGAELARLCQMVENLVVGAPCGIMDQMACTLGRSGHLLSLLCQPAIVQGHIPIPPHIGVWGVDSTLRHSVGGSSYGAVRTGAFMGLAILSKQQKDAAGLPGTSAAAAAAAHGLAAEEATAGTLNLAMLNVSKVTALSDAAAAAGSAAAAGEIDTTAAAAAAAAVAGRNVPALGPGCFLANVTPAQLEQHFAALLPEKISGQAFLDRYGPHLDTVTTVDPDVSYAVAVPTGHPVHENARVVAFQEALQLPRSNEQLKVLGRLMMQSHASYSACGLGSSGTDRLVQLVKDEMASSSISGQRVLYGARITGGGSGGTVAILGLAGAGGDAAVGRIVARYTREMRLKEPPTVFSGSSEGAARFGVMPVVIQPAGERVTRKWVLPKGCKRVWDGTTRAMEDW
ncbi:MAG: hypothetical protein WDW38_008422 [Sanguina aurantia]